MILLLLFSFIAGIVTILSPCILPILPVILSGSISGGKKRPFGVVTGFILSFTFFTLFLTSIVRLIGIPADSLRTVSIVIIFVFGLSLLLPNFQVYVEKLFAKLSSFVPRSNNDGGFKSGVLVGVSIGLIWTPCVGPILASVISLALIGTVTGAAVFITLAYSLGTAIPMLAIVYGGRKLLDKNLWLVKNTGKIQKVFGVVMILTAIGIFFNIDRKFQTYILTKFPNYGIGLTSLEDKEFIRDKLDELRDEERGQLVNEKNSTGELDVIGKAPDLIPGGQWFNLPDGVSSYQLTDLRGKVVLIDFWTYTCINCIRTFPFLREWNQKYSDKGLVIIGVHTPEFEFEKDADNVRVAIADFELEYPIMQDNDYATWRAFNNRYWPAKYLIDTDGNVRYTHFGEGSYDETERNIQLLLSELGEDIGGVDIDNPTYSVSSKTPELYLGHGRIQYLSSQEKASLDVSKTYSYPRLLPKNNFAYSGEFLIQDEFSAPSVGAKLKLDYEAKNVFLVMSSDVGGRVRVMVDGQIDLSGEDVIGGIIEIEENRVYEIVNLDEPGRHIIELEFLDPGIEIYAFTFG